MVESDDDDNAYAFDENGDLNFVSNLDLVKGIDAFHIMKCVYNQNKNCNYMCQLMQVSMTSASNEKKSFFDIVLCNRRDLYNVRQALDKSLY